MGQSLDKQKSALKLPTKGPITVSDVHGVDAYTVQYGGVESTPAPLMGHNAPGGRHGSVSISMSPTPAAENSADRRRTPYTLDLSNVKIMSGSNDFDVVNEPIELFPEEGRAHEAIVMTTRSVTAENGVPRSSYVPRDSNFGDDIGSFATPRLSNATHHQQQQLQCGSPVHYGSPCRGRRAGVVDETARIHIENETVRTWDLVSLWYHTRQNVGSNIVELSLLHVQLGDFHVSWVRRTLSVVAPTVQYIALSGNDFQGKGMRELCPVLQLCASMTTLLLDRNMIGDDGAAALFAACRSVASLTHLDVAYNGISDSSSRELAETMAGATSTGCLLTVDLTGNTLGGSGIGSVAKLMDRSSVTNLSLRGNALGPLGTHYLASSMSTRSVLKVLNLRSNAIGAKGAYFLARALQRHCAPYLEVLDLSHNAIDICDGIDGDIVPQEWEQLLTMPCCALRTINFSENPLGDEMCRVLLSAPRITELILAHVDLRNVQFASALTARHSSTSSKLTHRHGYQSPTTAARATPTYELRVLDVSYNHLSGANTLEALRELLTSRRQLEALCLKGNFFEDVDVYLLADDVVPAGAPALHWVDLRQNLFSASACSEMQKRVDGQVQLALD